MLFHTPRLKPEENNPTRAARFESRAPTPDINGANYYSLAPCQCFEGTSFSRFSLSQNVRLFGGSNQGWIPAWCRLMGDKWHMMEGPQSPLPYFCAKNSS